MELQFDKSICKSLHKVLSHVSDQELTQEIRLPESLPDIGRILGCWGQVILRSKEWYSGSTGVSGGIMVWVVYVSDDGSDVRSVDTWIPFQMKWDIPESQRDGVICAVPLTKSVDARTVSARKIMVRANVSIQAQAYESRETGICKADRYPEDLQVLNQTYHLELPVEAGEKTVQIEDVLQIQDYVQNAESLYYYELRPQLTETRILGDKLLFRGVANFHVMYRNSDNTLITSDQELPFSQYTHLDNVYNTEVSADAYPVVTGLELDFSGEKPMVKAGVAVQYVIYEPKAIEITEDVYSITRNVVSETESLQIFSKLDSVTEDLCFTHKFAVQPRGILDVVCYPGHAEKVQNGDKTEIEQPVVVQILYKDPEENLQCAIALEKQTWVLPSDPGNSVTVEVEAVTDLQKEIISDGVTVTAKMQLRAVTCSENGLPMTNMVSIKDEKEVDPSRASLIVRKIGSGSVWNIAKQYGAKVSDIKAINKFDDTPDSEQVLLIPLP